VLKVVSFNPVYIIICALRVGVQHILYTECWFCRYWWHRPQPTAEWNQNLLISICVSHGRHRQNTWGITTPWAIKTCHCVLRYNFSSVCMSCIECSWQLQMLLTAQFSQILVLLERSVKLHQETWELWSTREWHIFMVHSIHSLLLIVMMIDSEIYISTVLGSDRRSEFNRCQNW